MSRLVAVSNRIALPKRSTAPGGLAVGLVAAMQARGGLWFGWDGETTDGTIEPPTVIRKGDISYAATHLDQTDYKDFYLGFCNSVLWPLFHYFVERFSLLRYPVRGLSTRQSAVRAASCAHCSSRKT